MDQEVSQSTVFDSDQQLLGEVYAKALLGLGQQQGIVDSLMDELDGVTDALNSLPKFQAALESPRIAVEEKQQLIDKAFAGKVQSPLLNFLKIVAAKGRFDCLASNLGNDGFVSWIYRGKRFPTDGWYPLSIDKAIGELNMRLGSFGGGGG